MRDKINKLHKPRPDGSFGNDLYRKFKKAFDLLLAADSPAISRQEYRDWHVSTPELEEELRSASENLRDTFRFILGPTGIGKSTLIRYVFALDQAPVIKDRTLYIPIFLNNRRPHHELFDAVIRVCCRRLGKSEINVEALYDFIDQNRPDLLDLDPSSSGRSKEGSLGALREKSPFAYEMERLKFLLKGSTVERVIMIVDDIESLTYDDQDRLIHNVCRSFACLQNEKERSYTLSYIVSCRPSTHAHLRSRDWYSVYSFADPISINRPLDLISIFRARFDSAVDTLGLAHDAKNKETWSRAYEILMRLAELISDRYHVSITGLCNWNLRQSLLEFQRVLTNRTWFQRNRGFSPSFTIEDTGFSVTEASIYRALAIRNGHIYPGYETPIANLLWNTEDDTSDLLITYVIRYLMVDAQAVQEDKGVNGLIMGTDFLAIFPKLKHDTSSFEKVLDYMHRTRLIEKEDVQGTEFLSLTPRSTTLWRMLQSNSICLEFFRDDTYLELSSFSSQPTQDLSSEQLFLAIIEVVMRLITVERRHLNDCRSNRTLYLFSRRFGKKLVGRYLIGGVSASANSYFNRDVPETVHEGLRKCSMEASTNDQLLADEPYEI